MMVKYRRNEFHEKGFWLITRNGASFLRNEIDMPKKVQTQDNRKVGESQERVRITDLIKEFYEPYWQETFSGIRTDQPALF